ncbi:unnamed protein product [Rodentolepis nana]|uniref:MATH domain-containing protein n=1 Tax=Rodentolepis nana TaxID=102285 RepID=A0A0R3T9T7_RODNA|nr:unnamed protein product [Rodentolepis nana]
MMKASIAHGGSRRKTHDTFSPEGTDDTECDESSNESELIGETSDVDNNENEIKAIDSPAVQSVWFSVISNERKFSFSGKKELSIAPNPFHEGKIWPIVVCSLFLTEANIELIVRETDDYADYLRA